MVTLRRNTGFFILMKLELDLLLEVTYMLRESNNSLLELCVKASPKDLDINCQRDDNDWLAKRGVTA